ncbi:MAG: VOC family protein [Acidobacteriota bacterium]|nr:MAG: VOC family protein [Acidobacteriota bacterium]
MSETDSGRIDYVEFPARDIAGTKRFFQDLFGWEFQDYGPDYTCFRDGRLAGGFYRAERCATVDGGSALIVFRGEDLEALVERVRQLGGTVSREIFSFPGGRRFHFLDPSGNEFAIWAP